MSSRGGGRRFGQRRDQPSQAAGQQPSQRQRGGRGRGRGAGRGGDRSSGGVDVTPVYTPVDVPSVVPVATVSSAPAVKSLPPSASSGSGGSGSGSVSGSVSGSSSGAVGALTSDLEKRLMLQPSTAVVQTPPSSSKDVSLPKRPGYGSVGRKCIVKANHFLAEVAERDLHHYDVSISPEVTSRAVNRAVMKELTKMYCQSNLGNRTPAFDGRKSLYTAGPLPFVSKEFVVKLPETDSSSGSSGSARRDRNFKVAIKFASKPDLHHLQQFLRSRQLDAPQETIQVLDVVLRASPSEKYTVVGRSFFSTNLGTKGDLGDGIQFWRGYYQSLRPTQMGLSLNIDVSARSFYDPILLTEFAVKHLNFKDLSRPLPDQDCIKLKKALRGIKIELINRENGRRYKITGISSVPPGQLMFTLEDNLTRMSVAQYFREKYNVVLKLPHLPAIQAGSDAKPVYLPLELCRIVEGQRYTKKLNERQVTNLLRATCQRPQQRESSIRGMVTHNNFNGDFLVSSEFGIRIREELAMVDARILPPPMLKYHDSGKEKGENPRMGQWNMINKKMFTGGKVEYWTCVNFSSRVHPNMPFDFCGQLVDMCNSKGMDFNPNPLLPIRSSRSDRILEILVDIHKQSTAKLASIGPNKLLQLLIIILPDVSGSYGKIKRVCETELGIVTQCCKPQNASKFSIQYFENVALKLNVKVGGRNAVLNDAIQRRIPLVSDRPTIIIGADVTHPQPGEDSCPSIAAVVASMDWPEITKYRGLVSAQPHREEIIQDLYKITQDPNRGSVHGGMIRELFVAFFKSTGYKPHRIIFYRDGVSEGQFSQVLLYEMDAIRKACASLEEGYLPLVTFVVVQKRHHTRLFPAEHGKRDLTDKSGNIQPGTVVDTKICHPTEFDFYLNSHAGIQGTSRPAHYHVLYDENNFTADALQVLTNNLCYTYQRCTRSVSIVPPAYYAHLAAFRARYYIEDDSSDAASTASGRGGNVEVRTLPVIKDNVKDVMFYC